MKSAVLIALCAILMCHLTDATRRPKRTIGMLENLINRVRETLNPTEPPPPEVILATKLPYGFKYTYYPTVRMQIRPIQKHVIYMKEIQTPPVIRHAPPVTPNDVEILRNVQPILRLPKTKTTTTIHYEIIPVPLHVPPPLHVPSPIHVPSSSIAASAQISESEEEPAVPWTMEELPPPVPTAQAADPIEEPMVPWHMHALPPPVATKRPKAQSPAEWFSRPVQHVITPDGYIMPFVKKKLLIPAQMSRGKSHYERIQPQKMYFGTNDIQFIPSPLHSEINIEPSVEIAAYSENQPVIKDPSERYIDHLQDRGPQQTFESRQPNARSRRDISFNFSTHRKPADSMPLASSQIEIQKANKNNTIQTKSIHMVPIAFLGQTFTKQEPILKLNSESKNSERFGSAADVFEQATERIFQIPKRTQSVNIDFLSPNKNPNAMLDFGEYVDNGETDNEDNFRSANKHRESKPYYTNNLISVVRAPEWIDGTTSDSFVAITPRPLNYTRNYVHPDKVKTSSTVVFESKYSTKPENLQNDRSFESRRYDDERFQFQRKIPSYFDTSKEGLRFPDTGLFSKFPQRKENNRELFSNKKSSSFSDRFFDFDDDRSSRFKNRKNDDNFQRFDYDNIEYFEPIIIDIDKEKQKSSDFGPKLKFKYKNGGKTKSSHESLRLPDNLHETVDYLQKTLMHPPIFDLEGESNEPKIIAIMNGNEIT